MNQFPPEVAREFRRLLADESGLVPGACILRVESPRDGMVFADAVGPLFVDGDAATPATPFRVASITKTLTAAAIVQLAHEGALEFDAPMAGFLPDDHSDLVDRLHVLDGRAHGRAITIRQLLVHSSGLFDYASCDAFFGEIVADPGRAWTPRRMLEGAIAWGTPHFEPEGGYGYAYSDTGYVLLGLVIENLDRRPLHESYRARILDPLGMTGTYLEGFEEHRGSAMAHPFQDEFDTAPIHGSADWAGGGLVSTAEELSIFARALAEGRVVPRPLLDEMLAWEFRTLDPSRHSPGFVGYGMGVEARRLEGVELRGHRGHWGSWMSVQPDTGLTITGTINQAARAPHTIFGGVVTALAGAGLLGGER